MKLSRKIVAAALSTVLLLGGSTAAVSQQPRVDIRINPPVLVGRFVGENQRFCFYRYPDGHLERLLHRSFNRWERWDRYGRWDRWDRYDLPIRTSRYGCPRTFTIRVEIGDRDRDRYDDYDGRNRDRDRDRERDERF